MRAPVLERWRGAVFRAGLLRVGAAADAHGAVSRREELLGQLAGDVLEVGAGAGATFAHYPETVRAVTAIEPDPVLRAMASDAAETAAVPIAVVDGLAERLPLPDASVDWVVCSLVLCTVPDVPAALAEIARVLRPDGRLAFFEHVRSRTPVQARFERVVTPVWSWFAGGCHLDRDTVGAIEQAGFSLAGLQRWTLVPGPLLPPIAHVSGVARRPGAPISPVRERPAPGSAGPSS